MPDQTEVTLNQVAPGGVVQLHDAPASLDDATFDSLFPAEPTPVAQPQAAPQTQVTPATTQTTQTPVTQTQTTDTPFLKGERSVYKTSEAALEGINQKDALIEQLRQRYALTTGIDPITGQPVGNPQNQQPQVVDYTANPQKYLDDLYEAAKSKGPEAYSQVQQKFLFDSLKPLKPMIDNSVRQTAFTEVSKDVKDFSTFYGTQPYAKALDANPILKEAITNAESDFRYSTQLPGLYKAAYFIAQGMQLPDILAAQNQNQTQTQQTATPPRTTVAPSTPSAPTTVVRPNFRTKDGLKSIIADAEARGVSLSF